MVFIGSLQQLGRAFMLPMIVLPGAAIFLSLSKLPWDYFGLPGMEGYLLAASETIFTYLPYIFALGISLGLTGNALAAGMAALVGMAIYSGITGSAEVPIEPTVLIGTLIGIISGVSHERFKSLKLPEYIQFFGGPRFVPLFVSVVSLLFSIAMINIAPYLQSMMINLGEIVESGGGFGVFLYGFVHRILVVFGLHHLVSHVFWFQIGSFETASGQMVYGDLPRFFAGDPTAGSFMAGLYPTMMFALPAIAFAIIHEAREDLKPKIRKTFMYATLASFLTGVTERLSSHFCLLLRIYTSSMRYCQALSCGLLTSLALSTDSPSAGAIDYVINEHLATRGWLIIPIGIVVGFVYYFLFRWAIRRFRIPTPGREEGSQLDEWAGDIPYRAPLILQAIGGKQNIEKMESCITRLRLKVSNDKLLDINALRNLGAAGVIKLGGGHVQVVFGTYSELIREEMIKTIHRDQAQVLFHSPMQGRMIPLDEVPDPIFAGKLVGQGVAFIPEKGELVSRLRAGDAYLSDDACDRHSYS